MQNESATLFKMIENVTKRFFKNVSYDKIGMVIRTSENNTCEVVIDNQTYKVKNGTEIKFNTGDSCLVHYINGNEHGKVILAKL